MDSNLATPRKEPILPLRTVWEWIVKVPKTADIPEQPPRLVAALSALMAVVLVAEIVRLLLSSRSTTSYALLIVSTLIVLAVHALNRQGNFKVAALGLTGVVGLAPYLSVVSGQKDLALLSLTMIVSACSVPLTLIFFTRPKWALTAAVILAVLYVTTPIL